jgi:hypothetical protein
MEIENGQSWGERTQRFPICHKRSSHRGVCSLILLFLCGCCGSKPRNDNYSSSESPGVDGAGLLSQQMWPFGCELIKPSFALSHNWNLSTQRFPISQQILASSGGLSPAFNPRVSFLSAKGLCAIGAQLFWCCGNALSQNLRGNISFKCQ